MGNTHQKEKRRCRICYEQEGKEKLFSPCMCSGSMGFVHMTCIEKWTKTSLSEQCEICHAKYTFDTMSRKFHFISGLKKLFTKKASSFHFSGELKKMKERKENNFRLICPLCWEWVTEESSMRVLHCGHVFHTVCDEIWRDGSRDTDMCNTCRTPILFQPFEPCRQCGKYVLQSSMKALERAMDKRKRFYPLQNTC